MYHPTTKSPATEPHPKLLIGCHGSSHGLSTEKTELSQLVMNPPGRHGQPHPPTGGLSNSLACSKMSHCTTCRADAAAGDLGVVRRASYSYVPRRKKHTWSIESKVTWSVRWPGLSRIKSPKVRYIQPWLSVYHPQSCHYTDILKNRATVYPVSLWWLGLCSLLWIMIPSKAETAIMIDTRVLEIAN